MTKLREGITFAAYGAALKQYLQIPASSVTYDAQLEMWLLGAASYGDLWLANPFEGMPEVDPYPPEVLAGVYEYVKVFWSVYKTGALPGIASTKTDALSERYGSGGLDPGKFAKMAARELWRPYRCKGWR
jgi:hypothetical protein